MPSFRAKTAFIEWQLRADVRTQMWPDVEESFAIVIVPSRAEPR
jgi:hypothetical protein